MKGYSVNYRKDEFIRVYFVCDESLKPMTNVDDYNYVVELVESRKFESYEEWTDTYVDPYSIEIENNRVDIEPQVVVTRDGIKNYETYLASKEKYEDTQNNA